MIQTSIAETEKVQIRYGQLDSRAGDLEETTANPGHLHSPMDEHREPNTLSRLPDRPERRGNRARGRVNKQLPRTPSTLYQACLRACLTLRRRSRPAIMLFAASSFGYSTTGDNVDASLLMHWEWLRHRHSLQQRREHPAITLQP